MRRTPSHHFSFYDTVIMNNGVISLVLYQPKWVANTQDNVLLSVVMLSLISFSESFKHKSWASRLVSFGEETTFQQIIERSSVRM